MNNAGIGSCGPLEFLPVQQVRELLEVNVLGQLSVIQAFLPLLRQAEGRIVNIGSISGRLALPPGGAYSLSKFAMEALTDELRLELRPWHLHIALVEPGGIATPLWEKSVAAADRLLTSLPSQAQDYCGRAFPELRELAMRWGRQGTPARKVASAIIYALTARHPRTRYYVGRHANIAMRLLPYLPDMQCDALITRNIPRYP